MVIGNNDFHTELVCTRDFLYFGDTTINRNQELRPLFCKCFNSGDIHTVSFVVPMWNIYVHIVIPNFFKKIVKDDRTRDTITIIITKNDNLLLCFHRLKNAQNSAFHPLHKKRIVHISLITWIQEPISIILGSNTAVPEKCLCELWIVSKFVLGIHCGILS